MESAVEALRKAASKDKTQAIQAAVGELNTILTLLKLSSSTKVLASICDTFRDGFTALYTAFPLLMFQFSAAVLRAIFRDKIEPADNAVRYAWEIVQKAVVSSVLDFLEQNPSESNKTAAATALYPTIRDLYYPLDPESVKWQSPNLIFNVNMLLGETVTDHPENQSRLRSNKVLGPKRMASTLSQSRDFFAIDSLLGLIGALLPARQPAAKRAAFVDAVFPSALFPRSAQIKSLIAAAGKEWDPVVTQIINECLAKADIAFPQPFYISGLRTSTPLPNIVDPLYVDNKGLFANIEQDGVLDSYQVSFTSVERVSLTGATGGGGASVTLQLCAAPLVGGGTGLEGPQTPHRQAFTMAFQLKAVDRVRFVEVFRARGLGKLISDATDRKVSTLAECLSLEFTSKIGSEKGPATQQEKVAKVEQLWQSNEDDTGWGEPTSPLVTARTRALLSLSASKPKPKSGEIEVAASDLQAASSEREREALLGDELSDVSVSDDETRASAPAPAVAKKVKASKRAARPVVLDSDEEDGGSGSGAPTGTKVASTKAARKSTPRESIVMDSGKEAGGARARRATARKVAVMEGEDEGEGEEEERDGFIPPTDDAMDEDFEPTQTQNPAKAPARDMRATRKAARVSAGAAAKNENGARCEEPVPRLTKRSAEHLSSTEDAIEKTTATSGIASKPASKAQDTMRVSVEGDECQTRRDEIATTLAKAQTTSSRVADAKRQKRAKPDEEEQEHASRNIDKSEPNSRPTKRARETAEDVLQEADSVVVRRVSAAVFGTETLPPAKKRYGKKGRAPSPANADSEMEIDFDQLPAAQSPSSAAEPKAEAKMKLKLDPHKSRVAAMKGKGGRKTTRRAGPATKAVAPLKTGKNVVADRSKRKAPAKSGIEKGIDMDSDGETKPTRRSARTAKADMPPPKPVEPKAKVKPKKAPWEDMHLKKSNDVPVVDEPQAWSDSVFEEYLVPFEGQDDVSMIDSTHDVSPPVKTVQAENANHTYFRENLALPADSAPSVPLELLADLPVASTSALPVVSAPVPPIESLADLAVASTSALPIVSAPVLPIVSTSSVSVESTSTLPLASTSALSTVSTVALPIASTSTVRARSIFPVDSLHPADFKPTTIKANGNVTTSISPSKFSSPATKSEPDHTESKTEVPVHLVKPVSAPSPSSARFSKIPIPVKQPTPLPASLRMTEAPTPPPVRQVSCRQSPALSAQRRVDVETESPLPELIRKVAFAPSRASPSPSLRRRTALISDKRTVYKHGYSAQAFGRISHKYEGDERSHDYKRSRSPMQGIIEVLNEIQEVMVEKITQRFDHVRHDVRVGRDNILRGAVENLERMCLESEAHFNILVDLEEEYAAYHRKIILGIDDMQKSAEVMFNSLGQIIQHHDRHTLSKKLPVTLFTLPSVVRSPFSLNVR
ncbi:hypothetical protein GGX14DRAFT_698269 [Mycena pura]|uniref:Uncharacterized protein n=1 Tax=Mycena pura TaxID=153505 RepID=A0AAD6VA62_9AGAR|nr:hypothetical protein GGX14DRAFT_698269 [Mycena pura]